MKIKLNFVIVLCALLLASSVMAQSVTKKKAKTNQKPQPVEQSVQIVTDDIAVSSVDEPNSNRTPNTIFEPVSNIRYNSKFEIYTNVNDRFDFFCDKYATNKSNYLGIVDKSGNVILPNLFSKGYSTSNTSEVLLHINNNYGLFNINEQRWDIPIEYESMSDLGNNLYSVKKNGKWGVVDNKNNIIVAYEWYEISNISGLENYLTVTANTYPNKLTGIYSLVERKLTIPCLYTNIQKLDKQNYFRATLGSKMNIVDINNVPRFKQWYDDITAPYSGRNFYIVKSENKYGVVDDNDNQVIPIEYQEFSHYPYSDGSYLARNKDGKYGFILIDGRITLPFEYDNLVKKSNDNVFSVQNGKCGLVQVNTGAPYEIVTCNYDDIKSGNKTFIVEKAGKFGLLDMYGKMITPLEFQSIETFEESSNDGIIFKAKKDDHYLLLNEQGKSINDVAYIDVASILNKTGSSYYYNTKFTYLKGQVKKGKFCIIDKVGKTLTGSIFDDIISESENIFVVKLNGRYGLYSILNQKLIVDYSYDLIIKSSDNYLGITGKKIDFLYINAGEVTRKSTSK